MYRFRGVGDVDSARGAREGGTASGVDLSLDSFSFSFSFSFSLSTDLIDSGAVLLPAPSVNELDDAPGGIGNEAAVAASGVTGWPSDV